MLYNTWKCDLHTQFLVRHRANTLDWYSTQQAIQACRYCETECVRYLKCPRGEKRSPPWQPARPVRLYFVAVAPPWGGAYFWDETQRDAVREGLFRALQEPLGVTITNCRQFRDLGLFLTPMVKCPSSKDDKDHHPLRAAIRHCASFLRDELLVAEPERILTLGRVPFQGVCKMFGVNDAPRTIAQFRTRVTWSEWVQEKCRCSAPILSATTGIEDSRLLVKTLPGCWN